MSNFKIQNWKSLGIETPKDFFDKFERVENEFLSSVSNVEKILTENDGFFVSYNLMMNVEEKVSSTTGSRS